jgi:hypothetical protein
MLGDSAVLRVRRARQLGVLGCMLWRRRAWRAQPAHIPALLQLAGMVAFFASRYRLAAAPWIAMLGAALAEVGVVACTARAQPLAALVAAAVLVLPPWFGAASDFGRLY